MFIKFKNGPIEIDSSQIPKYFIFGCDSSDLPLENGILKTYEFVYCSADRQVNPLDSMFMLSNIQKGFIHIYQTNNSSNASKWQYIKSFGGLSSDF